jgi:CheY-like chemotaxis protein
MKVNGSGRRSARVLHVEDDQQWVKIVRDSFKAEGILLTTASTLEEAWERLNEHFYHVAILDISFDAGDPEDYGGLLLLRQLAERGLLGAMDVMIISAYGSREALRDAFKHGVADFLDKFEFDESELVKTVTRLTAERVYLGLEVFWEQSDDPEQSVLGLSVNGERVMRGSPLSKRLAEELDDLLRRLFRDALSVQVRSLEGEADVCGTLWARPFYASGPGQTQVVRFGDAGLIDVEYRNHRKHVLPFIGGRRSTAVLSGEPRRTSLLGGVTYSLLGSSGEPLETFSDFYARADVEQIKELLNRLFLETCGAWYSSPGGRKIVDLAYEYRRSLDLRPEVIKALAQRFGDGSERLSFALLGEARSFANPFTAATEMRCPVGTYECITHGSLTGDNVLVGDGHWPWLINFGRTGAGHLLRDLACLDSFVRFRLLTELDATLTERLRLEESLCAATGFGRSESQPPLLVSENPAICKAHAIALHLRELARTLSPEAEDNFGEYDVPLFYYALDSTRRLDQALIQTQHSLISASLTAERLGF